MVKSLLVSLLCLLSAALPVRASTSAVEAQAVLPPAEFPQPILRGDLLSLAILHLRAKDFRFGGYSGLWVDADGMNLYAVSDKTGLLRLRLLYGEDGALTGVADAEFSLLCGETGVPFIGLAADAETIARLPDGSWVLSFEQKLRLWRYRSLGPGRCVAPETFLEPPATEATRRDAGFEALALLADGRVFVIAENVRPETPALHAAFLWDGSAWREKTYRSEQDYSPTDAAVLPGGDILVLERFFRPGEKNRIRVRRIAPAQLEASSIEAPIISEITPPFPTDNVEGLAVFERDGAINLLVISDDNFNDNQRTLLMHWRLIEPTAP